MSQGFGPSLAFGIGGCSSRLRRLYVGTRSIAAGRPPLSTSSTTPTCGNTSVPVTTMATLVSTTHTTVACSAPVTSHSTPVCVSAVPSMFLTQEQTFCMERKPLRPARMKRAPLRLVTDGAGVTDVTDVGPLSPIHNYPMAPENDGGAGCGGNSVDLESPPRHSMSMWDDPNFEERKQQERAAALASVQQFFRCGKDECARNILDIRPPSLRRQRAFAFKELVQVQCPICHDHSEVPLYY